MDVNGISTHAAVARKDGALPCVAQAVRVLLVAHYTTFLMSLASQFEEQRYEVTTIESAKIALALFQQRKNYYDIVIVDICIPEMGISEFVEKLHGQRMTVPIILIAEESMMDLARETIGNDVCYVFPKPPSPRDISNVWQHILRMTGEIPTLSDMTNYTDGGTSGAIGNQKQINLNMKSDKNDGENVKRKMSQIAENPNSSNDAQKEDGHKAKKPRLSWTSHLDKKFLEAINILGNERGAQPKTILRLMNEPGLTPRHIASHLQKYRRQKYRRQNRRSLNLQGNAIPVMPVLPATTVSSVPQGQTFGAAISAYATANEFNYGDPDNSNVNAIINDGVQVPEGNGGGSNDLQAPSKEAESANGRFCNDFKAPSQEPTGKLGTVLCGFGNAGRMGNMKNYNLGEGTSGSYQQFDGMPSNDNMNYFMQDLETSEDGDLWDWFN